MNSEASPDGHNWATAAFSTDYVDKGFRWEYSNRGRTYDWEGYNRLPDYEPPGDLQLGKFKGDVLAALADLLEKHLPYRQGFTDLAEPKSLYLWDAANWDETNSFPSGNPIASSIQTATNFEEVEIPAIGGTHEYVVSVSTTFPAGQSFTGDQTMIRTSMATPRGDSVLPPMAAYRSSLANITTARPSVRIANSLAGPGSPGGSTRYNVKPSFPV